MSNIINPPNFTNSYNCKNSNIQCGGQIFNHCIMHLEPRLQEYIKKRDIYKKNNIETQIPLEKEFRITQADMRKVNSYDKCIKKQSKMDASILDGFDHPTVLHCVDKNTNTDKFINVETSSKQGSVKTSNLYKKFDEFGKDVKNLNKCVKDWKDTPCHKPLKYIERKFYQNCNKSCKNGNKCNLDGSYKDANDLKIARNSIECYGLDCDNKKNCKSDCNNIFDAADFNTDIKRCNDVSRSGQSCASRIDAQLKVVIPTARARCTKDENINHSYYKAVPYMGQGSGQGDIDMDSVFKYGEPTRGSKQKKLGGITIDRFEELPWDVQTVENTVLPFPRSGYDTRFMDKYSRRNAHYVI